MKMVHGQLGTHIKPDIKTWTTMLSFCVENTQTTTQKKKKKSEEQREREKRRRRRRRKEKHEVGRRVIDLMERLGVQGNAITEEKKTLLLKQMRCAPKITHTDKNKCKLLLSWPVLLPFSTEDLNIFFLTGAEKCERESLSWKLKKKMHFQQRHLLIQVQVQQPPHQNG